MKRKSLVLIFSCWLIAAAGQNADRITVLKQDILTHPQDTSLVNQYLAISRYYNYKYPDTVLYYASLGLELAGKLGYKEGEVNLLDCIGEAFNTKGQYPRALQTKIRALQEAEKLNDPYLISGCHNYLGALYIKTDDPQKALFHYQVATENKIYFNDFKKYILGSIGQCYFNLGNIDSAYLSLQQSYELDAKDQVHWSIPYYWLAAVYDKKREYENALRFFRAGNQIVNPGALDILNGYNGIALVFDKMGQQDSAIIYAMRAVEQGMKRPLYTVVIDAGGLLSNIYKSRGAIDSAFKYQQIMLAAKDSLFGQENIKIVQNLTFNEQQRQQELEQASQRYKNKLRMYSLLAGLVVLIFIAFILYRNNRHKQRTNDLLEKKNEQIASQRDDLEATVLELKAAQKQLIQQEKMASLGELTAGIAHEIQNPLNFVNNFSDVNTDLINDLEEEARKGNMNEIMSIAKDITANEEKINHHGRRADAIVKGMLQHSRSGTGQKVSTDVNSLADEYLRLSYHGFTEKDHSFNVVMQTDFDRTIGKINIIPQDIGRVLLNLYNNAFYAVKEKQQQELAAFQPNILVTTKKIGNKIEITVRDNGNGIPESNVEKIFQPFYTTKPAGQGTGLGLSLSYNIVKAHDGEIRFSSKPGEYSEFIVVLPA